MKKQLMATAAALAILTATAARADEISDLKAQSAALKRQNQALEQRLNKLEKQEAAQQQTQQKQAAQLAAAPAPTSFMAADLSSLKGPLPSCALPSLDGPLTFCGITVFGTVDAGLGWVSHGLPENGQNYEGQSLINKFTNHAHFGIAQNSLSQTTLGVKGEEELLPGLSGVFLASTGINPQSGQLANMPGTLVSNQGLNRANYSFSGDGGRGGQPFNDQLYVGLASPDYGQLTFGRHRTFTTDLIGLYDPAGGAYAFSPIGFNGQLLAGLGATEDARWDDSFKYRVAYGPVHAGAMYKFADGTGGCNYTGTLTAPKGTTQQCFASNNDAAQFDLGGSYGGLDVDVAGGYFHQATIMAGGNAPLSAAQLTASTFTPNAGAVVTSTGNNVNTLNGIITDTAGVAAGAKYTWNQFKFFVGYDYENLNNPHDNLGIGATNDQGGYLLSQANNHFYAHARILQTVWTGVKYAYDPKTDITLAYYHTSQNRYGDAGQSATCSAIHQNLEAAQCSGTLDVVSLYADYHFTKRFDVYAGMEVSNVEGGLAGGTLPLGSKVGTPVSAANYGNNYYTNWAPTIGARFTF
ncbi:porin [Rhodoblastus sp.]|uniref:porin n=1 Tax=Rhodoblastus sp. TaxID=1962975 RepID=UPI003F9DA9B0